MNFFGNVRYNNLAPRIPNLKTTSTIKVDGKVQIPYKCKVVNLKENNYSDSYHYDVILPNKVKMYFPLDSNESNLSDCKRKEWRVVDAYPLRVVNEVGDTQNGEKASLAGCAPIAWGQVMKYHKWPPRTVGKLDYNITYDINETAKFNIKVKKDLNHGVDFKWDNEKMPLVTPENNNSGGDPSNYISTLLSDIGYALECEWGDGSTNGGTGCVSILFKNKITNHFGYSNKMNFIKYSFNDRNLLFGEQKIYFELRNAIEKDINNSMPLIFAYYYIKSDNNDTAHATVVDGYNYFDLDSFTISINLGWGGTGNNFYTFTKYPDITYTLVDIEGDGEKDINITAVDIVHSILPCSGDSDINDCSKDYLQNGGVIKKSNFNLKNNWQLKALTTNKSISSNYFDNVEVIYTYEDNVSDKIWYKNPINISPKQGFWVKHKLNENYLLIGENDNNTSFINIEDFDINDNNWHLLGTGNKLDSNKLNETFYHESLNFTIWIYDDNESKWIQNPSTILGGQGFWAKKIDSNIKPLE